MEELIVHFGFSQMRDWKDQKEVHPIFYRNIFVIFSLTINWNCGKLNTELEMINNNCFVGQSRFFNIFWEEKLQLSKIIGFLACLYYKSNKRNINYQCFEMKKTAVPVGIYLLKVKNRNTRTRCERCSKISHLFLVFLLLTLNM